MIRSVRTRQIVDWLDATEGYRAAARREGPVVVSDIPEHLGGPLPGPRFVPVSAPPPPHHRGVPWTPAFLWMKAVDRGSAPPYTQVFPGDVPTFYLHHATGDWEIQLDWYYANGDLYDDGPDGQPEPPTVVRVDAFDIDLGVFIRDEFVGVEVIPPDDALSVAVANSGNIYTDINPDSPESPIPEGSTATLTALEALPHRQFAFWLSVDSLLQKGNAGLAPTVGAPDRHDVVFHFRDNVVAFAFYHDVTWRPPSPSVTIDWLWGVETHGGITPGSPPGPPWGTGLAALQHLANAQNKLAPELRAPAIELTLRQLAAVESALQQELAELQADKP